MGAPGRGVGVGALSEPVTRPEGGICSRLAGKEEAAGPDRGGRRAGAAPIAARNRAAIGALTGVVKHRSKADSSAGGLPPALAPIGAARRLPFQAAFTKKERRFDPRFRFARLTPPPPFPRPTLISIHL